MVRGFVEQQDIGRRRDDACQCRAARFAARECVGFLLAGQAEALQQILGAERIVSGCKTGFDEGERRRIAGEVGFLRQVANRGAGCDGADTGIRLDEAGGDLQQSRLAGSVASHEAQPVAFREHEICALQQRRAAEGQ